MSQPKPLRVQVPASSDRWMMGDRYGEVIALHRPAKTDNELDHSGDIYEVKHDKSGKVRRYWADDCTVVTP